MRFVEDGPNIPNELITARDEGRVIFFCGAGISIPYAKLPNFNDLTERVLNQLGIGQTNSVYQAYLQFKKYEGVSFADKIFGQLEEQFEDTQIDEQVAIALNTALENDVDISAHKILLDLATTPEGQVKLVTTNFDLLFEKCGKKLKNWLPPHFPRMDHKDVLDGLVYLHGRVNEDYSGSDNGFVLSSSEFGKAYISGGWATTFIQEVISKYVLVFIGYSAEDPPVQYLLEAHKKSQKNKNDLYALYSYKNEALVDLWKRKGVTGIPYKAEDGDHSALWKTLEQWASRARDRTGWFNSILELAKQGPKNIKSFERGQVAQMVSDSYGAGIFFNASPSPPPEWLCVFDSNIRYSKPDKVGKFHSSDRTVDPFHLYHLDTDDPPQMNEKKEREKPKNPWCAFDFTADELKELETQSLPTIRYNRNHSSPNLPARLNSMGRWIAKNSDEVQTVWWASRQGCLHNEIIDAIRYKLNSNASGAGMEKFWNYLFQCWEMSRLTDRNSWSSFKKNFCSQEWDNLTVRQIAFRNRPYLEIEPTWNFKAIPPDSWEGIKWTELATVKVAFNYPPTTIKIPPNFLPKVLEEFRKNLLLGIELSQEVGANSRYFLSFSFEDDEDGSPLFDQHNRSDFGSNLGYFWKLFRETMKSTPQAALVEFENWPDDDSMFSLLKLRIYQNKDFINPKYLNLAIANLSEEVFWNGFYQADLLKLLHVRWSDLTDKSKVALQKRMVEGPKEERKKKDKSKIYLAARISYLIENNCALMKETVEFCEKLKESPDWKPEYSITAAKPLVSRTFAVKMNTNCDSLIDMPAEEIIERARLLAGRQDDMTIENDPFLGLVQLAPRLSFEALKISNRKGDPCIKEWDHFLYSSLVQEDESEILFEVAKYLVQFLNDENKGLHYASCYWLDRFSERLSTNRQAFVEITQRLISMLQSEICKGNSALVADNSGTDWVNRAYNSPAGYLTRIAIKLWEEKKETQILEQLLNLEGQNRSYSLAILGMNLSRLFSWNENWTEKNILKTLGQNSGSDKESLWNGIFFAGISQRLFLRLKENLLQIGLTSNREIDQFADSISGILIFAWISQFLEQENRVLLVSNEELREVVLKSKEHFRVQLLVSLRESVSEQEIWFEIVSIFLDKIWPSQKVYRTSKTSEALTDLVLEYPTYSCILIDAVLPCMTTVENGHNLTTDFYNEHLDPLIESSPIKLLSLLDKILPQSVYKWPFGIGAVIQKIEKKHPSFANHHIMLDLKTRINTRL
ncbi:MAG: SIR2 family protein [Cyanobacteria bacterium TGS_CYA1]|nr:SIR2 family protein [Cyanobacteria bacterium TGS_CYA1]